MSPPAEAPFQRVAPFVGLIGHPVNVVRRLVRRLLAPWLDVQTRFNHAALETFCAYHERTDRLVARVEQALAELAERVYHLPDRVAELRHDCDELADGLRRNTDAFREARIAQVQSTQRLESRWAERIEALEARWRACLADEPLFAVSRRVLQETFLHARLPEPPARILELGATNLGAELRELGFDVVDGAGPPPEASFDFAVYCADAAADAGVLSGAWRALEPGGRMVLSAPADPDPLAESPAPFRVVEAAYARREGRHWAAHAERPGDIALLLLEKV